MVKCAMDNNLSKKPLLTGGADLHLHTIHSDGSFTPEELVREASALKLETISITDHDNVGAIEEALSLAPRFNIEVIPGIEVTCSTEEGEIHILGYFIDHSSPSLLKALREIPFIRQKRMRAMIKKLREMGLSISEDHFFEKVKSPAVGRLHLATYLVREKIVGSIAEVFGKYLGDGKPAHIKVNALNLKEGIELISNHGGLPFLAHPGVTNQDEKIPEMIDYGLKGIEVYNLIHDRETVIRYEKVAIHYGLLTSGGSDCHGANKKEKLIGKLRFPMDKMALLRMEKYGFPTGELR